MILKLTSRHDGQTVITGWRAWLVGAPILLIVVLVVAAVFSLVISLALTVFTVLLFVLPIVVVLALVAGWFQSRRLRQQHQQFLRINRRDGEFRRLDRD